MGSIILPGSYAPRSEDISGVSSTPSIAHIRHGGFAHVDIGALTITDFTGAPRDGFIFHLRVRSATGTSYISGTLTGSGRTVQVTGGEFLSFMWTGSAWEQIGGDIGTGATFVPLNDNGATLSGWISSSVTTFTEVAMSGVRYGAVAVSLHIWMNKLSAGTTYLHLKEKGTLDALDKYLSVPFIAGGINAQHIIMKCSQDLRIAAKWDSAWTYVSGQATVKGYWI